MPVVLDSRAFAATERYEAFPGALEALLPPPNRIVNAHQCGGTLSTAMLGPGRTFTVLDLVGDLRLRERRPPRGRRDSNPERVAVGTVTGGRVITDERGKQWADNDGLRILDLSDEYGITYEGSGHVIGFDVDCASLGLPVEAVRAAMDRGTAGPMNRLLRRHLLEVAAVVETLSPGDLSAVGLGTSQLVRGFLQSGSDREIDRKEAAANTLMMRIDDYVSRCLSDRDLTPIRIAAVHNISLRQLYVLFSKRDQTPSEWIMAQRLEAAKEDLERRGSTVTAVAQRWGFKDQSHFTRRFKAAFGLTPHEHSARARAEVPTAGARPRKVAAQRWTRPL